VPDRREKDKIFSLCAPRVPVPYHKFWSKTSKSRATEAEEKGKEKKRAKAGDGSSAAWFDLVCSKFVPQIRKRSEYDIGTLSLSNQFYQVWADFCASPLPSWTRLLVRYDSQISRDNASRGKITSNILDVFVPDDFTIAVTRNVMLRGVRHGWYEFLRSRCQSGDLSAVRLYPYRLSWYEDCHRVASSLFFLFFSFILSFFPSFLCKP